MFKGIDHIVISVADMSEGLSKYEAIFNKKVDRTGEPEGAGFLTAHFEFENSEVELVQPTNESGPVAKHVDKTGGGMYLLSMRVDDLMSTLTDLRGKGIRLIGDPGEGETPQGQVFVHPADAGGVLLQLVEG